MTHCLRRTAQETTGLLQMRAAPRPFGSTLQIALCFALAHGVASGVALGGVGLGQTPRQAIAFAAACGAMPGVQPIDQLATSAQCSG